MTTTAAMTANIGVTMGDLRPDQVREEIRELFPLAELASLEGGPIH